MNNGMKIGEYKGHVINMLGSGYNCPSLNLFGFRTERQVKSAISRKLNKLPPRQVFQSRLVGLVAWFEDAKGYGFIRYDGGPELGAFVHYSAIQTDGFKTLVEGQKVYFDLVDGPKGPQAINVTTAEQASA